jgi:hypothetical protein
MAVVWLWLRQVEPHDIPPRRGDFGTVVAVMRGTDDGGGARVVARISF